MMNVRILGCGTVVLLIVLLFLLGNWVPQLVKGLVTL